MTTMAHFDTHLHALAGKIAEMGGFAEQLVSDSLKALHKRDVQMAKRVIAADLRVDQLLRDIEEQSITMIARRQPVAQDLREIVGAMRIAHDLERIGDLAKNIAKRAQALQQHTSIQSIETGLNHMSSLALEQIKLAIDSFVQKNKTGALEVWGNDGAIDALYTSLFRELLTYMMEDPRYITGCTHLLFIAKNIERMGDHATNIAETVHYMITGETLPDNRPKDDGGNFATLTHPSKDE